MEPHDDGAIDPLSRAHRFATRWPVLVVSLVMVLSVAAPAAAAAPGGGPTPNVDADAAQQVDGPETSGQWTDPPGQLDGAQVNDTIDEEKREAAEDGVDEAVETLQRQGVSVNQSQRAAAVNGTLDAVAQHQNASVEQVQNVSYGAVAGTFLQSQNVTVEQVQNATAGGAAGALSQHQNASATQLQHAAFGATHGAVAQQQNASVEQVQIVAQGAAAGAAHEASKRDRNDSKEKAHPGAIREAAQGAAFGALVQEQSVSVEQRQSAAAGAAEGALNQNQSVTVEQRQTASVKQIQVAAMGAAEGALSVTQRQEVTVEQVQSAARGACKGALEQHQSVSVTQIQSAAHGAAKGAISQSQTASVTQIQAAATGAAKGVLVQTQSVSISQIQYAASGAAKGAAGSAAQSQVVNVEQIQAAAAGAGQGSVIQIQEINIVQIQIISQSAADGALSQHQSASVTQIQSAARGASEGATSLTQRQEVNVEQTQIITRDAASDTAATAAQLNIDVDQTIYNYAKGTSEDPGDGDADDGDDQLQSLFVSAEQNGVFLANPNDVAVTVTVTSDDGDVETVTLAPGESTTVERDRGTYTVTAETADGEDVEVAGRDELTVSVGDELQSLTASVEDQSLAVENPNDERVTVDVSGDLDTSFDVPGNWKESQQLGPGTYTATAETTDGESVQMNGEDAFEFTIESEEQAPVEEPETPNETDTPEEPEQPNETDTPNETETPNETVTPQEPQEPIDVNVTVGAGNLSFDNPSETAVTVTATDENDSEQTVDVPGGENVTEAFDPGTYDLTGESDDERDVLLDNQTELTVDVPEPPVDVESLNATVEGQNVSIDNPNDATVTVTANATDAANRTVDVGPESNVTEQFDPGNYTLTAETDDGTAVPVNGQQQFEVNVSAPEPGAIDLNITVDEQNVSVENPSDTPVTVTATNETDETQTLLVGADENLTEEFVPGNYTLAGESDDERDVLLDNESELEIQIEEPSVEVESLNVSVDGGNVTVDNPNDAPVTVSANSTDAENRTVDVGPESNVTEQFDPGTYTLTAETADGTIVPLNESTEHETTIEAEEPTATGTLTVEDQTGDGTQFVVANASATVPFVVEIGYDSGAAVTEEFGPEEALDNATLPLDPPIESDSNVTVTVRAAETDDALANETVEYDVAEPFANVSMADQTTDGETVVVQYANLTEGGFLAIHEESANGTDDVLGATEFLAPGEYENVTVDLEAPLAADATVNATAHRDTDDTQAFDFVTAGGAADEPYVNETGEPVTSSAELTIETGPEPGIEYVNCTTAQVNGTYDRLGVTLNYYTSAGNETSEHLRTAVDVPADRPVDGQTLVTVGEQNETTVTDDGTLVIQIADPGAFGEETGSFVASVNTSESPAGQSDLSTAQPTAEQCREDVRPELPTVDAEPVEVVDNETALVNFSYENPNDAPMTPADSLFTNGEVADEPPTVIDSGQNFAVVEWTPESTEEVVTWTLNLSNFDLINASAASPTAADVPGLLEPPEETAMPVETETPTPEATETPTPEATETPEPTPEATPIETETPEPTSEATTPENETA